MKKWLLILSVFVYLESGKVMEFKGGVRWEWVPGWSHSSGLKVIDSSGTVIAYLDTQKDDATLVSNEKPINYVQAK